MYQENRKMKKQSMALMAVALIAAMVFLPTVAYAGSPFRGISKGGIRTPRIGSGLSRGGRSGLNLSGLSRSRGRTSGLSGLSRGISGSPFRSGSHGSKWGGSDLFRSGRSYSGFGGFGGYGGSGWGGNYYRHHDDLADAYRDVGIANAVVGLVGVMAHAATAPRYTYAAPPPAVVAAPAGYWARQAVVVQPERYEQYQEWIPEIYDARTGQKTGGGYYETRTRLSPQVVEYRNVWVAP
jgi:hypothetical protein